MPEAPDPAAQELIARRHRIAEEPTRRLLGLRLPPRRRRQRERPLDDAGIEEMFKVIQMRRVVAFEFKARAIGAQRGQDMFDIAEGVASQYLAYVRNRCSQHDRSFYLRIVPVEG